MSDRHSLRLEANQQKQGKVSWLSPSNLAIVKYWGKHGRQLPRNASISFTLDKAHSKTSIIYQSKSDVNQSDIIVKFRFHGEENEAFANRIKKFFASIKDQFPFIDQLEFTIDSENTFPHSSGIASSASGMSVLALGLCDIEQQLFGTLSDDSAFYTKASHVARLGSGSACRSVYPYMASWGVHPDISDSSDEHATVFQDELHDVFKSFHDDILIVSASEKSVSSTAGHALMEGNPYAAARYQQAQDRMHDLMIALKKGDLQSFGKIAEDEALTLHALMMCSDPSYMLVEPNTIAIINELRAYRQETNHPVYFSLDAGPNIHLLYPDHIKEEVVKFRDERLMPLTTGVCIEDQVGTGPKKLA